MDQYILQLNQFIVHSYLSVYWFGTPAMLWPGHGLHYVENGQHIEWVCNDNKVNIILR